VTWLTEGEVLWPAQLGPAEIADFKARMSPRSYNGQFQQRPTAREGGIIKREWLRFYHCLPRLLNTRVIAPAYEKSAVEEQEFLPFDRRGTSQVTGLARGSTLPGAGLPWAT
jgi:hypothetical protein